MAAGCFLILDLEFQEWILVRTCKLIARCDSLLPILLPISTSSPACRGTRSDRDRTASGPQGPSTRSREDYDRGEAQKFDRDAGHHLNWGSLAGPSPFRLHQRPLLSICVGPFCLELHFVWLLF